MFIENALPTSINQDKWIQHQREEGWQAWLQLGIPTKKQEEWKYSSTYSLAQLTFTQPTPSIQVTDITPYLIDDTITIVIENGAWTLSPAEGLPSGIVLTSLKDACDNMTAFLQAHLGSCLDAKTNGFTALNIALMQQGYVLHVPNGVLCSKPIHIIAIATHQNTAYVNRNLIVLGEHAAVSIIETFVSTGKECTFTNTVTEMIAERGAKITYCKRILENDHSYHVGITSAQLYEQAQLDAHSFALSGGWVRSDVDVRLMGAKAATRLLGLYQVDGKRHLDHHTRIDHAVAHCTSEQQYRGVIEDAGHAVFNGKVIVREYAADSHADQLNKNILLSKDASVDTKPQLEIFNDNVRCTHGTTVGQLDDESVFYLTSRGIPLKEARAMLLRGFASEITRRVPFSPLQQVVESHWMESA